MKSKRPSSSVAVKLREARTRRNISLRQIADSTKISICYLQALERNDISRLPGGLFSRAFVRGYASEVGLDPEKMVEAFLEEFPRDLVGAGHPTTTRLEQEDAKPADRGQVNPVLWMAVLGAPVVGGLMYFGLVETGVPGAERAVIARAAPSTLPSVVMEAVAAVPEYAARSSGPLLTRASSPEGPQSSDTVPSAVPGSGEPSPQDEAQTVPRTPLTVDLRATGPCWVSAIVDGERAIQREFKAGEQQSVIVRTELVLTTGDAAALDVAFNGVDARPLGAVGQIVTTSITPDNFEELIPTQ